MSSFSVYGLSSGIDYNDLILKFMEVQRQPINILKNKKSLYNERISQYISLSSKLSILKNAAVEMKTLSNFYLKSASMGDSMVMEIIVPNSAVIGNYSITITKRTSEETEVYIGVDASTTVVNCTSSTITVIPDRDTVKEQINSFIRAYNDVIDLISKNMVYDSVTGEGGILSGEDTVKNIQNSVRNIISSTVFDQPDDLNVLAQLGITIDSKTEKLRVNTSKLYTKLSSDLDDVVTLFTNSTSGIANQFYNYISIVDAYITIRVIGLENVIANIDKTIKNMEYRLDKTEEALVRKYT